MAAEDSIESPASQVQSGFRIAGSEEAATPVNCGLPRNCAHSPWAGGSAAEPSQTLAGMKRNLRRSIQLVSGQLDFVSVGVVQVDRMSDLMIFESKGKDATAQLGLCPTEVL